ncbi:MAG: tripartite tricarboxylate transporter permease, partial [Pseudomonadota bacterium]
RPACGFVDDAKPSPTTPQAQQQQQKRTNDVLQNPDIFTRYRHLLRIPYTYLAPTILVISIVGVYSVKANTLDLWIMVVSGLIGYVLRKFEYDVAPLLLALVLGERIELNFRRALTVSDGDYAIFFQGVAAKVFLVALAVVLPLQGLAWAFGYHKKVAEQAEREAE